MDSTLDDEQIASLKEQISNLAREAGPSPSTPPTSMKTSRAPLATIHRLADWRYVAFVGSLLAAYIGVAAWWWSSSVDTAMMAPSDPAPLTQAAPEAAASLVICIHTGADFFPNVPERNSFFVASR